MFKSIQFKLLGTFALIVIIIAIMSIFSVRRFTNSIDEFDEVVDTNTPALILVDDIRNTSTRIQSESSAVALVSLGLSDLDGAEVEEVEEVEEELAGEIAEFYESIELIAQQIDEYEVLAAGTDHADSPDFIRTDVAQLIATSTALVELAQEAELDSEEILEAKEEVEGAEDALYDTLNSVLAENLEDFEQADINADNNAEQSRNVIVGSALLAALLSMGLGYLLTQQIIKPLSHLKEVAINVEAGDLSQRSTYLAQDELGILSEAFNQMIAGNETRIVDLDSRVKERTAELQVALREAREATRLKDEFLSVMSHELRTPLNAIMGYQGIMKLVGDLEEENQEMVERTLANAERLLNLINDVLDISRIEAGRLELFPSDIQIHSFVSNLKSQMQVLADEKDLAFEINIADNVPPNILIDEDGLTKVMTNLLGNAFKFTKDGRVSLNVGAKDNQLTVQVKDTGVGIPVHMQDLVFEKFRQVDSSSKRAHGGSGLGLNIVQQYVQAMGGTISVQSELNSGATFDVIVPFEPVTERVQ